MAEAQGRRRTIGQVLLASLWLTLLVFVVKVWIGWATQSLSLIAEALQTLINGFSILLSAIATTSRYPASRDGGHGRLEAVLALLLAAFMGFACLSLLVVSVQQLEAIAQDAANLLLVRMSPTALSAFGRADGNQRLSRLFFSAMSRGF